MSGFVLHSIGSVFPFQSVKGVHVLISIVTTSNTSLLPLDPATEIPVRLYHQSTLLSEPVTVSRRLEYE